MKTIAISIDEASLQSLDRIAGAGNDRPRRGQRAGRSGRRTSRSQIIRRAIQEFLARYEKTLRNERERAIFARHCRLIARQAEALVGDQAEL